MIITETFYNQSEENQMYGEEDGYRISNGKTSLKFHPGEPEDNTLGRDWSDVYSIIKLLKEVYEASKNGEEVVFVKEDREFEEYWS